MSAAVQQDSVLFTLDFRPLKMTDAAFYEFCRRNKDFRFEMDKRGTLIVMPPTFLEIEAICGLTLANGRL